MSDTPETAQRPAGPRKLAEWVSLGVSVLILVALVGFLLYESMHGNGPIVPAEVKVRFDQVERAGERYVVPVEVHNRGTRTMQDAKFEVRQRPGPDGDAHAQDFTIDYLAEGSSQTVYVYFDTDPTRLDLRATILHYRLE